MATVVFIPGFLKPASDFNETSSGKRIGIIDCILRKNIRVQLLELAAEDYLLPIEEICNRIEVIGVCILVAHSYGGLIAHKFCQLHPEKVGGLVLLDCPMRTEQYRTYLEEQTLSSKVMIDKTLWEKIRISKLERFDELPDDNLAEHIICHVFYRGDVTRYHCLLHNEHSKTICCDRYGHMIHYKMAAQVIASIVELYYVSA